MNWDAIGILALGFLLGYVLRPLIIAIWALLEALVENVLSGGDEQEPEIRTVRVEADVVQLASGRCYACEAGSGSGRQGRVIAVMVAEIPVIDTPLVHAEVAPPPPTN